MALYFGTTEITGIDNLVPQTGLDITDLWFGSTNIYTVWETYEGTLPATINTNGDNMKQYQIYGNTGGVGDRTVNLFDKNAESANGYLNITGIVVADPGYPIHTYEYIPVDAMRIHYVRAFAKVAAKNEKKVRIGQYDSSKQWISRILIDDVYSNTSAVTIDPNCAYVRLSIDDNLADVYFGTTPPETYVPYGYKLDISTSDGTSDITTPIYIGDDPLEKDEYVDYGSQKVYRMIEGTLTPTDPPVPLPALPTCEGTTTVDYAGSGTAPEKVLLKYRKEGY